MKTVNFQKIWNDLKTNWIFSAIVTVIAGLILLLFPTVTLKSISYVVGGISIAMGVIRTVRYFKRDHTYPFLFQSDLVVGLLSIGLGLFMVTRPETFMSLMPLIFGLLLVGCGIGNILRAVDAKKAGIAHWGALLALAILAIALGWLILLNPFAAIETAVAAIGGCLIFEGVTDLFTTLAVSKRIDAWKKTIQQ